MEGVQEIPAFGSSVLPRGHGKDGREKETARGSRDGKGAGANTEQRLGTNATILPSLSLFLATDEGRVNIPMLCSTGP